MRWPWGRQSEGEHIHLYHQWPTQFFACTDFPVPVDAGTVLVIGDTEYAPVLCYEGNCLAITLDERGAKVFAPVIDEDTVDRTVNKEKLNLAGAGAQ